MNKPDHLHKKLFPFLIALVVIGVTIAFLGVYIVDGDQSAESPSFEEIQNFDIEATESRSTIYGSVTPLYFQTQGDAVSRQIAEPEKGFTVGELMRWAGIVSIIVALVILFFIEFFYKGNISRLNYRSLMIVSMFALPMVVVLSTGTTVLETTKTVKSCASCHVMDPFVNDLFEDESSTLAARHKKNGWISEHQCYTCHTTYGAHGTFEGKRDGFRHWLLYVTQTWDEPIRFAGSYPNQNCTACHGGTESFRTVPSHIALADRMRADEVSCTSCHGPAHPTPEERDDVPDHDFETVHFHGEEISSEELTKYMEMFHE